MTRTTSNISLADFRAFLQYIGCEKVGINGGHEKWRKKGCLRPIVFQTHIDPIPKMVVSSNLKTLGLTREGLTLWLKAGKPKS